MFMDMYQFSESDIKGLRKEEEKAERRATLKASFDKIKQGIADNGKRSGERAIWELIQNARDYSGEKPAVITIELSRDQLTFTHQGIPFTIRTIKDLILQQSTKHEGGDTVGQYGTGFMTTHEFSRKVFIKGDCRIGKTDVYVPLPEGFCLDRTSLEDEDGFINEMESELDKVDNLFDSINQGHSVPRRDTVFTYPFELEGKAEKVSSQIATTMRLMPFVLVFNDKIQQCTVVNHLTGETVSFGKGSRSEVVMEYDPSVKLVHNTITILEPSGGRGIDVFSLESADGNDRIILPPFPVGYDDVNSIPSQFIFFPLLGTEKFGTGFIFHSKRLYPTEKRESFLLPWDNDNMKTRYEHNETVIDELIKLLFDYYDHTPEAQCLPVAFAKVAISRTPEEEPDAVRRGYLSKLQQKFADKFIHWKMIPTEKGFMSIQNDAEILVLHKEIYEGLSEEDITTYLPTIISYAGAIHTIPSEHILDWSRVVLSWNPDKPGYYISLEDICKSIKEKSEHLKSFLDMLTGLGRNDLLKSHQLIPNREGVLHSSGYLLDGKEIPSDLYSLAKPLMSEKADMLVDPSFAGVTTLTAYSRKDLQATIKQSIDNLRQETHKWRRSPSTIPEPRCLVDTTLASGPTLDEIVSFCSAFPVANPQDFRSRLMRVVCKLHSKEFSPVHIVPLPQNDVDLYDSAFNYIIDETMLMLSMKESSWLTNKESGASNLGILREFLQVYTETKDSDRTKKLDQYGIFPNMLFEMCLPSELKKGKNGSIPDSILNIYKEVALVVGEKGVTDYRAILVNDDFSGFYAFEECKGGDITDKIESMLREKDKDYSWSESQSIILKIIQSLDNGEWPDESLFREIRGDKKTTIFFKNTVSGDKGKHVYTLLRQSDEVIKDLAEMTTDPEFGSMITLAKELLRQKREEESDLQFKKAIGTHIEYLLRKRLSENLDSTEFHVADVQNGQDIVILYHEKPIYYVEVKTKWNFTTSGPAYMSKNQVLKACEEKERYALCCVDLTNCGLPDRIYPESLDGIMDRIKLKFDIGGDLKLLMQPSLDADNDPENNISIDGDFKARIPAGAFRKGYPFDTLVSRIIDQALKSAE